MGGWVAVDTTGTGCVSMCVCASQTPLWGMDAIPDQLCWKILFHSEGLGKGAWEAFRLSHGEQGGAAWAAELVLAWAVSTGSSDGIWDHFLSASSLCQHGAGSPAPHPNITAQAAQKTPGCSKPIDTH